MSISNTFLKRDLPVLIVAVFVTITLLNLFFEAGPLVPVADTIKRWANVVAGFTLFLGGITLSMSHMRKVANRVKGEWYFSVLLLVSLVSMVIVGLALTPSDPFYLELYNTFVLSYRSAVRSTLAFLIIIAAFVAFRVHNIEATILLGTSILIMLMYAPIGEVIWSQIPVIGDWVLMYPNSVVKNAIRLMIGLGTIGWAMQIIIGRERRWVGDIVGGEE